MNTRQRNKIGKGVRRAFSRRRRSNAMIASWARRAKARQVLTDEPTPAVLAIEGPKDLINHPSHYIQGRYEVIDMIEDIGQFYSPVEAILVGNIIRYLARAPHKGGGDSLKKAQWYLNRLVERHTD